MHMIRHSSNFNQNPAYRLNNATNISMYALKIRFNDWCSICFHMKYNV